jgi:YjbE family integral membrane protein
MEQWFILFAQIMMINLVLSGDNALVIAMASKGLPSSQRRQAVWWGAAAAIILRILLTLIAVVILQIPYIQALGSLLLIWVAFKLLHEEDNRSEIQGAVTLWGAVWVILLADFVMSLDNVLAIAAKADGNVSVIIIGIMLSIPIIVWGSNIVLKLLQNPLFIYVGVGILGYTAGEMFVKDVRLREWVGHGTLEWSIPLAAGVFVVLYGMLRKQISPGR